jgi:4-hydroxybenzoate polyprenyltransferase
MSAQQSDLISAQQPERSWKPWLAALKMGKVTFWFIWITPVIYGYVNSATKSQPRYIALFVYAILGTCFLEAINCMHNELVDQEEDSINQPRRASLLQSIGEARLRKIVIGGYLLCVVGLIPLAIFVSPLVVLLMAMGGMAAPLYNWGPRFKRRPGMAEVAIGWATFFGYLWGWGWNQPLPQVSPVIWVVTYFFAITSLMKDLPDVAGDEMVRAASVFSIQRKRLRLMLLYFIYLSPYALIIILVLTGILPPKFLVLSLLIIPGLLTLILGERVNSLDTLIVGYELAFLYVHIFFLALFIIDTPTRAAIIIGGVLFVLRCLSVYLGLAPRFVEEDFKWSRAMSTLVRNNAKGSTT